MSFLQGGHHRRCAGWVGDLPAGLCRRWVICLDARGGIHSSATDGDALFRRAVVVLLTHFALHSVLPLRLLLLRQPFRFTNQ